MQYYSIKLDKYANQSQYNYMSVIKELVFGDELIEVFDHISSAFGFRTSVLDTDFKEVVPLSKRPLCSYCRIVQQDAGLLEECRRNDRLQCIHAGKTGNTHYYTCHAGLAEAVYPLFTGKRCIGYVIVGQFRTSTSVNKKILRTTDAQTAERLSNAYHQLPFYDNKKLESVLKIIEITTHYLIDYRIVNVRQNVLADQVVDIIKQNLHQNISLCEAAAFLHRSPSTISHTLKKVIGKSYNQVAREIKMNRAADLLLQENDLPVSGVAEKVGFQDPFYFSRVFKKFHGTPPRSYRNRHMYSL